MLWQVQLAKVDTCSGDEMVGVTCKLIQNPTFVLIIDGSTAVLIKLLRGENRHLHLGIIPLELASVAFLKGDFSRDEAPMGNDLPVGSLETLVPLRRGASLEHWAEACLR